MCMVPKILQRKGGLTRKTRFEMAGDSVRSICLQIRKIGNFMLDILSAVEDPGAWKVGI
jgi:hypothetical protein